jgi:hypothetical protein
VAEEVLGIMNQQIKECGLMLNARQHQKAKTKHVGRCNEDVVPGASWKSTRKIEEEKKNKKEWMSVEFKKNGIFKETT